MTLQPYPAGTQWSYDLRGSTNPATARTEELVYLWEANGSALTDDYLPDEITPRQLWDRWVTEAQHWAHKKDPKRYLPGDVTISWYVTTPALLGTFEAAPFQIMEPPGILRESFRSFFTHPAHVETSEPLNWLRLPVLDRGWNSKVANKGGFIQELLGWKPSPLQHTMNVQQLAAAAGL